MRSRVTPAAGGADPRARGAGGKRALAAGAFIAAAAMGTMSGCGDRAGEPAAPSSASAPAPSGGGRLGGPPGAFTPPAAHASGGDPYAASIEEERRGKDAFFRASPESPVPTAER